MNEQEVLGMCHITFENKDGFKVAIGYVETPRDEQPSRIEITIYDIIKKRLLDGN